MIAQQGSTSFVVTDADSSEITSVSATLSFLHKFAKFHCAALIIN